MIYRSEADATPAGFGWMVMWYKCKASLRAGSTDNVGYAVRGASPQGQAQSIKYVVWSGYQICRTGLDLSSLFMYRMNRCSQSGYNTTQHNTTRTSYELAQGAVSATVYKEYLVEAF